MLHAQFSHHLGQLGIDLPFIHSIQELSHVWSHNVGGSINPFHKGMHLVRPPLHEWSSILQPLSQWRVNGYRCQPSKITTDDDCSHEIKRCLLLGRKVMINLDSIVKSRDITLTTKVRLVKAMVFPVVMSGCESWTIKKAEHQRIMLLNCGVGEDSLESLGQQRHPTSPS